MATYQGKVSRSYEAGSDLSTKQYYFVKINSSGQLALAGDGEAAIGVLQDKPSVAGQAAEVAVIGDVQVISAGTIAAGAPVSCDSNGKAQTAGTGDVIMGTAVIGASAGDIFTLALQPRGIYNPAVGS